MSLDEQLLNRDRQGASNSEAEDFSSPEPEETPSLRSAALRAAKQSSGQGPAGNSSRQANNLNEAKQMAKVGAQLVAGNKVAAVKTILKDGQMRKMIIKRVVMAVAGQCACCLIIALFWVVIIALLLKVISNPIAAAGVVIGWVWGVVKEGVEGIIKFVSGG